MVVLQPRLTGKQTVMFGTFGAMGRGQLKAGLNSVSIGIEVTCNYPCTISPNVDSYQPYQHG